MECILDLMGQGLGQGGDKGTGPLSLSFCPCPCLTCFSRSLSQLSPFPVPSEQISLIFHHFTFIPLLKQMSRSFILIVVPINIASGYFFYYCGYAISCFFNEKMNMIIHQTITINFTYLLIGISFDRRQ